MQENIHKSDFWKTSQDSYSAAPANQEIKQVYFPAPSEAQGFHQKADWLSSSAKQILQEEKN